MTYDEMAGRLFIEACVRIRRADVEGDKETLRTFDALADALEGAFPEACRQAAANT